MKFLGKNGYEFELAKALDAFTVGQILTVQDISIGGWEHSISFVGVPGRWNGVMFTLLPGQDALSSDEGEGL